MQKFFSLVFLTFLALNANALERYTIANIVDDVQPSVVTIKAINGLKQTAETQAKLNPFDRGNKNQALENIYNASNANGQKNYNVGSGVIIDEQGYIVTNYHIVEMAEVIDITTISNQQFTANIVGVDEKSDLALLKIDNYKADKYITFADSNKVRVGEFVIAVGNPYGLNGSVSTGIISARNRNISANIYDDFLQTDASINPGNSGGPLFNLDGEVIGINTAIFSQSGESNGVGFAIPSNTVKSIIKQLKEHGKVTRGWLGIETLAVGEVSAQQIKVTDVVPASPAALGDIKVNDIILEYNNQKITSIYDLPRLVADTPINKKVAIKVKRLDKEITLNVTILSSNNTKVVMN